MELIGFPVNKETVKTAAARAVVIPGKGAIKAMGPGGEIDIKPATEEDVAAMEKMLEQVNRYDGADRQSLKSYWKKRSPSLEAGNRLRKRPD